MEQVRDELALLLGDKFEVIQQVSITSLDKLAITSYGTTMAIIILITIFVEFVFLLNLFLIVVNERQKTIGLLRALGFSRFRMAIAFLIEIFIHGTIGTLLGLLIGHLMASSLLRYLLASQGLILSQPLRIQTSDLIFAIGMGLGVGFIASMYPMFTLLRLNVALTLNERRILFSDAKANLPSTHVLAIMGTLLGSMIVLLTYQGSQNKILSIQLESEPALFALGSMLLLLLTTTLASLLLMNGLSHISRQFHRLTSLYIATRNILRYQIRSIASILTNGLAFAFALVIIILTASLAASVPTWFEESYPNVDLIVKINNKTPLYRENLKNFTTAHPNIKDVIFIQTIKAKSLELNKIFDINGINASEFERFGPQVLQGDGYEALLPVTSSIYPALVSESLAAVHQISLNDQLRVSPLGASPIGFTIKVVGIVSDTIFAPSTNKFQIYLHYQNLEQALGKVKAPLNYVLITLKDKRIVEEVRIALQEKIGEIESITSVQENLKLLSEAIQRQKALLQALSIQAFLIAVITQFIAIILSTENGRREIGLLRALGLSNNDSFTLFLAEGLTLSILGIGIGIINGMIGSIVVSWYVQQVARPLPLTFNFLELGGWGLLYLTLTTIAILYPALKITELSPIEALDERPRLLTSKMTKYLRIRKLSLQSLLVLSFWSFLYLTGLLILPVAINILPIPEFTKNSLQISTILISISFLTLGSIYLLKEGVLYIKDYLVAYQQHYRLDELAQKILITDKFTDKSTTAIQDLTILKFPSNIYIPWHVKLGLILGAWLKRGTVQLSTILEAYEQSIKKFAYYSLTFINTMFLLGLLHVLDDPIAFMISLSSESTYLTMLFTTILLISIGVMVISVLTTFLLRMTWQLDPDIHPLIHHFVQKQGDQHFNITTKVLIIIALRIFLSTLFESFFPPAYSNYFLDCILVFLFYQLGMNYYLSLHERILMEGVTTDKFATWKVKQTLTS